MIKVYYEDINIKLPLDVYKNIYNFISSEAQANKMITNVHSVEEVGYPGSIHNVTFDYDNDIEVMIHILYDGRIHIDAPDDMITDTESWITGEFPELVDSFI